MVAGTSDTPRIDASPQRRHRQAIQFTRNDEAESQTCRADDFGLQRAISLETDSLTTTLSRNIKKTEHGLNALFGFLFYGEDHVREIHTAENSSPKAPSG